MEESSRSVGQRKGKKGESQIIKRTQLALAGLLKRGRETQTKK